MVSICTFSRNSQLASGGELSHGETIHGQGGGRDAAMPPPDCL